jgi:pimeloyl-ACP methyl ester carboxylesterase
MPAAVLVHGAWQGSWAWDRLTPLLAEAGIETRALDLPGNGCDETKAADVSLALYVAHVCGRVAGIDGRVVLVAHSGGGLVASQVAEATPERIAGIVYVAGMMLPSGVAFAELTAPLIRDDPRAAGIGPHLVWAADRLTSRVPEDAALHYFFRDCSADFARSAARRLVPHPERGRAVRPSLTPERFGRIPRLYVEALHDRSVVLAAQRRMQELVPGAAVVSLPTGHTPHLAAPDKLATCLIPWLREAA